MDKGSLQTVDSMYAHLDRILVREGQQITRGQQVGTIGTNRGMYTAHLHFEIRKNLRIGINRSAFARDLINYYRPGSFIAPRRKLPGGGRSALIPINTYSLGRPMALPADEAVGREKGDKPAKPGNSPAPRPFRVNRFDNLNW